MSERTAKHALVTGGGRGIGAAIAARLARDGVRVTLLGRTLSELEAHVAELNSAAADAKTIEIAQAFAADVTDERSVADAFARARERFGPPAILVNNAGIAESAQFLTMERAQWDRILAVNLTGTYLCAQLAVGAMVEAGWGRIVNVASTAGLMGGRYLSAYCASKHGVIGLTRSLAVEFAAAGVTVNAVCPAFVETAMFERAVENVQRKTGRSRDESRDAILGRQTRLVTPDEVADAVAWLCSEAAAAVTGTAIAIDASGLVS